MPVKPCSSGGMPGFKWGDRGKCFKYTVSNKASRERARGKAAAQGRAIKASGGR